MNQAVVLKKQPRSGTHHTQATVLLGSGIARISHSLQHVLSGRGQFKTKFRTIGTNDEEVLLIRCSVTTMRYTLVKYLPLA